MHQPISTTKVGRESATLVLAAVGVSVAVSSPAAAQGKPPRDPAVPPPVTWCARPAENPKWARQTVSLMLAFAQPDSSSGQQVLAPYVPMLLSGIARSFAAEQQPARDLSATKPQGPPPGEPRYGPADLVEAKVRFELRGDGRLGSVTTTDTTGSVLVEDLISALLATAARGDVFGYYADSSVRTSFELRAGLGDSLLGVSWPAFTLYAPVSQPAKSSIGNRVDFPEYGRGFDGKLVFRFVIDENGRAVPGSARMVHSAGFVLKSQPDLMAFESFKSEVEWSLPRMRYRPAQHLGCLVPCVALQEFVFTSREAPTIGELR